MQNKVVYVLLDGLQGSYAKEHLGYLEHLCEKQKAAKYEVLGELPSSSRPMYETIFTGVPVYEHGITNNSICRLSDQQHLFQMLKETGRRSLALAYYWISELYLSAPFDPMKQVLCAGATTVPVKVVPNGDLATDTNKIPFFIGDMAEAIILWDRNQMSLMTSTTASIGEINAFEQDLSIWRGTLLEDVTKRDSAALFFATLDVSGE